MSQCCRECKTVLNGLSGQKVVFFSCRKAEQREIGTTVNIGLFVPVILCFTCLQRSNSTMTKFVKSKMLRRVLNLTCASVMVSPYQEMTKEKR